MTTNGSNWYSDPGMLLEEVRRATRASAHPAPAIAGYEDFQELKRGGQGVVYRALQRSTRRSVAIKVLLWGAYATPEQRARFAREIDLAATLRHAHIVRVYDSGTMQDGRAYLVMEYVDGKPLDEWSAMDRTPRRILSAFALLCDAVQYAHTRGVIHRDLKPSNVRIDVEGQPRVLDFGLAKLSGEAGSDSSLADLSVMRTLTTSGHFIGSLPFASPEQASGGAPDPSGVMRDAVDTRSDIYSLGVMLYHALSGKFPYGVSGPLHEVLSNIVRTPPAPFAREHGIDEPIETIVRTALAKEPSERYQSAGALAADIRHTLAGEPIAARREGAWRVMRRQAARYRTIAWAGGIVLAVTTAAAAVSIRFARQASVERDASNEAAEKATKAQQAADAARARSDATAKFLTEVLSSPSPLKDQGGKDVKVADQLDTALVKIPETYPNDFEIQMTLYDVIGQTYSRLELFEKAREAFDAGIRAGEEHKKKIGKSTTEYLAVLGSRASLEYLLGNFEELIRRHHVTIAEYELLGVTRDKNLASCWSDIGVAYRNLNKLSDADDAYGRALAALPEGAAEGRGDAESEQIACILLSNRAMLQDELGKPGDGAEMLRRAVGLSEKVFGPESGQTNTIRSNLAYALIQLGKPEEGIPMMEAVVASTERSAGETHRNTLIGMNNLGKMYLDAGRLEEAKAMLEKCIERYRSRSDDPAMLKSMIPPMSNLGATYAMLKDYEGSLRICGEQLRLAQEHMGEKSFDFMNANNNYGIALEENGRLSEGEAHIRIAVELSEPGAGILKEGNPRRHVYRMALGNNLVKQGRIEEGRALVAEAAQEVLKAFAPTHPFAKRAAASLARLARADGNEVGAKEWDEKAR